MVKSIIVDVVGVTGLGLLTYGLYSFDPRIACVVSGSLMIAFAVKVKV
jgi:hypothetical protein